MQNFLFILLLSFFWLGIILIIIACTPIFKNINETDLKNKESIDKGVEKTFILLIHFSYVLIYTIINKVTKNHRKPREGFCASLTPAIINSLYSVEYRRIWSDHFRVLTKMVF